MIFANLGLYAPVDPFEGKVYTKENTTLEKITNVRVIGLASFGANFIMSGWTLSENGEPKDYVYTEMNFSQILALWDKDPSHRYLYNNRQIWYRSNKHY